MNENLMFLQDCLQEQEEDKIEGYLQVKVDDSDFSSASGSSSEEKSEKDGDSIVYCRGERIETFYEDRMGSLYRKNACCLANHFQPWATNSHVFNL